MVASPAALDNMDQDMSAHSREELLDHIALQRKLIRRLYRRLVELESSGSMMVGGGVGHVQQQSLGSHHGLLQYPPQHTAMHHQPSGVAATDMYGVMASSTVTPIKQQSIGTPRTGTPSHAVPSPRSAFQPSTARLSSPPPPSVHAADQLARQNSFTGSSMAAYQYPAAMQPPAIHLAARLTEEISRIDNMLSAHDSGDVVLTDDAFRELLRMRDKLALAQRTPYPVGGSMHRDDPAAEDQHVRTMHALRGMSAHTAPREKATADDVLGCGQWLIESPMSSRTTTPMMADVNPSVQAAPTYRTLMQSGKDRPLDADRVRGDDRPALLFQSTSPRRRADDSGAMPPQRLVDRLQAQLSNRTPPRGGTPVKGNTTDEQRRRLALRQRQRAQQQ